jgi:hypothetical protein
LTLSVETGQAQFIRRGRERERLANGLPKPLIASAPTVSAHPQIQLLAVVALAGLPQPVTIHPL